MKTEKEIKEKINEHQAWIDDMLSRTDDRDNCFWFDLLKLRTGQKALEWSLSDDNYLKEQSELDKMIEFEYTCMYATKIF